MPDKVVQPLLVEMGDKDEFVVGGTAADCKPLLDEQKANGAPLEYVIYPATHIWDVQELSYGPQPRTENVNGRQVPVAYDHDITLRSAHDAFVFLDRYLKPAR